MVGFPLTRDRWTLLVLQLKAEVFVSDEPISMRRKVQSAVETQQQELLNPPASNCTLNTDTKPWPTQTSRASGQFSLSSGQLLETSVEVWSSNSSCYTQDVDTPYRKTVQWPPRNKEERWRSRWRMRKTAVTKVCPIAKANSSICMTFASVITFHWVLYTDRDLITL